MLNGFKKTFMSFKEKPNNDSNSGDVYSPADGKIVQLEEVNDPVFQNRSIGDGCAVTPINGKLFSPISGEVITVFPTRHAIGIRSDDGKEILLHIGINTVELNGKGFTPYVKKGEFVKAGALIMEFDLDFIKKHGYDTDIIVILTNAKEYNGISCETKKITHGEVLFTVVD
ncbi:PTS glucose transporter subunit IIA [Camelliibacillus cellulosilyticus]|uniref:PTS glucose transporter subunit IIA n=1 Tax=Camelliibacillus cellulosilyticus TaxID=2174486 RepID=A0ABV9GQD1_9BACL